MIRILLITLIASLALALPSTADTRAVYTITDIPVDERASSVIDAQQNALASARRRGAELLIEKITLPEDLAQAGGIFITPELANRLAAAVDVQEETRGAGRYRGVLSVVINPVEARALLEERGIPYLDRQAPLAMIIPLRNGIDDEAWRDAWPQRAAGYLAPFIVTPNAYGETTEWFEIANDARALQAERGVLAHLRGSPGNFVVELTQITAAGRTPLSTTMPAPTLEVAMQAAAADLSEIWKRDAIVRSDSRTVVTASVLYTSIAEWNTLRGALARSPLVSAFQTDAVSRDGALVRFAFAGDQLRLARDLRQRGVELEVDPSGYILTSAVSRSGLQPIETVLPGTVEN